MRRRWRWRFNTKGTKGTKEDNGFLVYLCALGPFVMKVFSAMSCPDFTAYLNEARALHRETAVVLGYCDYTDEQFAPSGGRQCDLEKLAAAGVRTMVCSIGFGCYFQTGPQDYVLAGPPDWLRARQATRVEHVLTHVAACPRARLVRTREDLAPRADGTIGVILHLTGNEHTPDLAALRDWAARGVRAMHPVMGYHNAWIGGGAGVTVNGRPAQPLTARGRELIAAMSELGLAVDTAHAAPAEAEALIAAAAPRPVLDSHTGSRDLVPQGRGLPDAVLRRIAASGGVVGVHFADHLVHARAWERKGAAQAAAAEGRYAWHRWVLENVTDADERVGLRKYPNRGAVWEEFVDHVAVERVGTPALPAGGGGAGETPALPGGGRRAAEPNGGSALAERVVTLGDLAEHVEYLWRVVGPEHVGIGGDINGIGADQWPRGMDHVGELPHLTAELLRRGHRPAVLRAFLGANWLRLYAATLPA